MPGCCMSQVPGGSVWDGTRTGPSLDSMLLECCVALSMDLCTAPVGLLTIRHIILSLLKECCGGLDVDIKPELMQACLWAVKLLQNLDFPLFVCVCVCLYVYMHCVCLFV